MQFPCIVYSDDEGNTHTTADALRITTLTRKPGRRHSTSLSCCRCLPRNVSALANGRERESVRSAVLSLTRASLTEQASAIPARHAHQFLFTARVEAQIGTQVVHLAVKGGPCIVGGLVQLEFRRLDLAEPLRGYR